MVELSTKELVLLIVAPPVFLVYWYVKWVLKHEI